MPTLPRRFNFSRGVVDVAPSILPEPTAAQQEARAALTPQTRRQGARSRRSSILKRTASFPAATAGLIYRKMAKGEGDRTSAVASPERNILPSILDLSEPSGQRSPPEMPAPSSTADAGFTTFFTTVSACPKAISSSWDVDFCPGRSRNLLAVLTPCASVMAMYSGMMGGFGSSTGSAFLLNVDGERGSSRFPDLDVPILQSGPGWGWFLGRWRSCIDWLPVIQTHADRNWNGQPGQGQVSPWLTIFQVLIIMLLSISLYRNLEILFET